MNAILKVACTIVLVAAERPFLWPQVPTKDSTTSIIIHFSRPSRGMDDGPQFGRIVLQKETEQGEIGMALVKALQVFAFSIPDAPASITDPFPPRTSHKTDIVPLSTKWMSDYQASEQSYHLLTDRIIGLRYEISYEIKGHDIFYDIRSVLLQRGTGSDGWSPYKKAYNGAFFAERLRAEMEKQLQKESGLAQ